MPTITIPLPSGPSKRRIVELAFGQLTMAGYEFGRTPEEVNDALDQLDALMYEWPYSKLGYIHKPAGEGEPDELSNIPFETLTAVAAGLALSLAGAMGRTMPAEARARLSAATAKLYSYTASIPTMPVARNTPRGAGNGHFQQSPFIDETYEDVNPPEEEA